MLDLKFIRENTALVKKGLKAKGDGGDIDKILNFDSRRRELLQKVEQLKHNRNVFSQEVKLEKHELENKRRLLFEKMKTNADSKKEFLAEIEVLRREEEKLSRYLVSRGKVNN